jgi:hypothetical protein
MDPATKSMVYDITFERLPGQASMDEVLCRPWTEEIEDYKEYKRLRQLARDEHDAQAQKTKKKSKATLATDGALDLLKTQPIDSPLAYDEEWVESDPEWQSLRREGPFTSRRLATDTSI